MERPCLKNSSVPFWLWGCTEFQLNDPQGKNQRIFLPAVGRTWEPPSTSFPVYMDSVWHSPLSLLADTQQSVLTHLPEMEQLTLWFSSSNCWKSYWTCKRTTWQTSTKRKLWERALEPLPGYFIAFLKRFINFTYMCAHVCLYGGMCTWVQYLWRPEEGELYPRTGVRGICKRSDIGVGIQTPILWKSSTGS